MRAAVIGTGVLSQNVQQRLKAEGVDVVWLENTLNVSVNAPYDLFFALDASDEVNLVACALVKQLGPVKTVAVLRKETYSTQKELDIQRAFHVDHIVFADLLIVDEVCQSIFDSGIYSQSFLHGNVLLRTMQVSKNSSFSGKTLVEIRDKNHDVLVCLIHRGQELIFPHGSDILYPNDEITMMGETKAVLAACTQLIGKYDTPSSVYIVGSDSIANLIAQRLKAHNVDVRHEPITVKMQDLESVDVFVACHSDEEHNFVLALQAKDQGVKKVIAVLSDIGTKTEAEKFGIIHISSSPESALDQCLEHIPGSKVESLMSLYDDKAEILQMSVTVDSSVVGIPLSTLGPTLPKEILIGVIYTRGRIFIAGGSHILKPQDECLVITHPKHRTLLEKIM